MSEISTKQDVAYVRTAQDIERKYSFGKTFADMLGLINDNRDKVDSVESSLRNEIAEQSTTLKRDATEIVMEAKKEMTSLVDGVDDKVAELNSKVEMKINADDITMIVQKEISSGVDRVETKTGYVFDENGLKISKSNDEMENLIDNTGMAVKKSGKDVLVANNKGVAATDLHAKTYLIIGKDKGRSRFEDYNATGENRTGCFWIGG